MAELAGVLNEDLFIVVDSLLSAIETVNLKAPVARLDLPAKDFSAFRKALSSAFFEPYMESHAELEALSKPTANAVEHVSSAARRVVDAFPGTFELRETAVNAIQAVPPLIEITAGKAIAALVGPIFSAIADAIGHERRLILYSLEPAWNRVWGGKLDKVRTIVERERETRAIAGSMKLGGHKG